MELAKTRQAEYGCYRNMVKRCCDVKSPSYKRYGAKGVSVCKEWLGVDGYKNFKRDMGKRPSLKHSIDRIDNNKGYSKENCRWATYREQNLNKATKKRKLPKGVYLTASGTYTSRFTFKKNDVFIGTFKTVEEAEKQFKKVYNKYHSKDNI